MEQLIVLIPGLYLFSHYFNPLIAAGFGIIYLIGREVYAASYVKEPSKRSAGFGMSFLPTAILLAGGLVGAIRSLF